MCWCAHEYKQICFVVLCVGRVKYYNLWEAARWKFLVLACFVNCLSDGGVVVVATIKFAVMCVVVCRRYFFCSLWRRWTYKYTLNKNHLRHGTMNFWFGFWLVIVCFFIVLCDAILFGAFCVFYLGVFLVHLLADFIENICYKFTIVLCI